MRRRPGGNHAYPHEWRLRVLACWHEEERQDDNESRHDYLREHCLLACQCWALDKAVVAKGCSASVGTGETKDVDRAWELMRPYHVNATLRQLPSLMNQSSVIDTIITTEARKEVRNCKQCPREPLYVSGCRTYACWASKHT